MFQLGEDYIFPHPSNADKHGIVAYGGDLNPLRILVETCFDNLVAVSILSSNNFFK